MSLYVVQHGAPCVMIKHLARTGTRYASYCVDHAMIFEQRELLHCEDGEYHFMARDGKEFYFNMCDVRIME